MRIEIRLTQRCNFNCHYCTDLHNNNVEHIPFDFEGFDDLLSRIDDPHVFIYGGEPTTHPDCKALTDFLLDRGIDTTLQSNASNRRILKTIDPRIKMNYSYHSSIMSLSRFMRNISGTNINEIAFMADGPDAEYLLLKRLYKDKVQYCPVINSDLDDYSDNEELKKIVSKPIFEHVRDDYHFKSHANGLSNYSVWFYNIDSLGQECSIKQKMIHIQDNKVYFCFNALMKDLNGVPFKQFININETVLCPFKKCYFGMENWILKND